MMIYFAGSFCVFIGGSVLRCEIVVPDEKIQFQHQKQKTLENRKVFKGLNWLLEQDSNLRQAD